MTWLIITLKQTGWALLAVLSFWAIAAKAFHAYLLHPWLDMPTHFAGGLTIAYVVNTAIINAEVYVGTTPVIVRLLASLGLTAVAAVCWEFLEFLSDLFLGSHVNLGITDTLSDLLFGLLGALSFVVIGVIKMMRQ